MPGFASGWALTPSSPPAYRPPGLNFGGMPTSAMNQGFNPSGISHSAAQQQLWNTNLHFSPSNPPLNSFGASPFFNNTGYTNPANFAGITQQMQFSNAAGNSQGTVSQFGTQVVARE
jgi:hypothetical protein